MRDAPGPSRIQGRGALDANDVAGFSELRGDYDEEVVMGREKQCCA